MSKVLVTTAWPYGNGPIHLGHLAGSYLPADIYARFRRLVGDDVLMVSGTDMHGTPITLRAEEEGLEPAELAERYHRQIKETLDEVWVEYDLYTKTSNPTHVEVVHDFFRRLKDNGYIYEDGMLLPYCPEHEAFLPDRYVEGACPRCGFEEARGDQCDECGLTLDPEDLVKPRCVRDGASPVFRERDHFFFRLSEFQEDLEDWVDGKEGEWRPNVYGQTATWLDKGLDDRPVSRDMEYGIPVPDDDEDRVIYVWFEAVMGYLSATKKYFADLGEPDGWRDYWQDEDAESYYFIAKDNIPFHTVLWPAMLMGHDDLELPTDVPANEYLNLEGAQFSTSRGHALWVHEFLEYFSPDQLRYALSSLMPERKDSDFTLDKFRRLNNDELVATYGNFVHRVLSMVHRDYGEVPEPGEFDERDEQFLDEEEHVDINLIRVHGGNLGIDGEPGAAGEIKEKRFREALENVMTLARLGNGYLNEKQPWKQEETRKKTTLYVAANIVKALSVYMEPFLPHSSREVWRQLGLEGGPENWEDAVEPLEPGIEIPEPEPLFETVDEEDLGPWSLSEEPGDLGDESGKDDLEEGTVPFEDFQRLDIRVGEILEVERIEGSERLLKLTADVGDEERQLVAGLAGRYGTDQLVGSEVVVVVNLEPSEFFGVRSEGMVLAAGEGSLLRPDEEVPIGSEVK